MPKDPEETRAEKILKYCPRCGASPFAPQADHAFTCAACGLRFYLNTASAVAALIEDGEGRLLLIRRGREPARGTLDLPGGFVDQRESAEQALAREIREELKLELELCTYLGSFPNRYVFSGLTYHTLDLAFGCRVRDLSWLTPGDDAEACLFMAPADIDLADIGLESIRAIVAHYLEHKKKGPA